MRYPHPLTVATFVRRYKRFLADVTLPSGELVTVHCPNSGAMTTCAEPGRPALLGDHGTGTSRKLRYTLEAVHMGEAWVGINTMHPNRVVHEAIAGGALAELRGYPELRREVVYGRGGHSRIDLLLSGHAALPDAYVEVKNATLRVGDVARFPDAVTLRGQKHIEELERVVKQGRRGVLVFFVGRADCHAMAPADDIDPAYGKLLRRAVKRGVEALAYRAELGPEGIVLAERVEVRL